MRPKRAARLSSAIAMPTALAEPLAERAGRGLDPGRVPVLGVARGARAELAEALDLVDRHVAVAGQVEQPVEQHRAVPRRQHEAVAVRPVRRARVELQVLLEEHGRNVGHAHRHARMPGIRLLHRVHRQYPQRGGPHPVVGKRWRSSEMFTGAAFPARGAPHVRRTGAGDWALIAAIPEGQGGIARPCAGGAAGQSSGERCKNRRKRPIIGQRCRAAPAAAPGRAGLIAFTSWAA